MKLLPKTGMHSAKYFKPKSFINLWYIVNKIKDTLKTILKRKKYEFLNKTFIKNLKIGKYVLKLSKINNIIQALLI